MNAPNTPYRPVLSDAARPATFAVRAVDENGEPRETSIAGEHPLTLYVDKHELLTIMTRGAAPEALAIGYLRNQRLLERIEDVVSVQVDWDVNAVVVNTRGGLEDLEAKTAKRTKTTGCGQGTVFGDLMKEIDAVHLPAGATLSRETLYALLERVRQRLGDADHVVAQSAPALCVDGCPDHTPVADLVVEIGGGGHDRRAGPQRERRRATGEGGALAEELHLDAGTPDVAVAQQTEGAVRPQMAHEGSRAVTRTA